MNQQQVSAACRQCDKPVQEDGLCAACVIARDLAQVNIAIVSSCVANAVRYAAMGEWQAAADSASGGMATPGDHEALASLILWTAVLQGAETELHELALPAADELPEELRGHAQLLTRLHQQLEEARAAAGEVPAAAWSALAVQARGLPLFRKVSTDMGVESKPLDRARSQSRGAWNSWPAGLMAAGLLVTMAWGWQVHGARQALQLQVQNHNQLITELRSRESAARETRVELELRLADLAAKQSASESGEALIAAILRTDVDGARRARAEGLARASDPSTARWVSKRCWRLGRDASRARRYEAAIIWLDLAKLSLMDGPEPYYSDDILYYLARGYQRSTPTSRPLAIATFELLLRAHPNSSYAVDSRRFLGQLRDHPGRMVP